MVVVMSAEKQREDIVITCHNLVSI